MKKYFHIHNLPDLKQRRRDLRNNATSQEQKLWFYLKNSKLGYKFRRQHSIGYYIADFYCPEKRLIIEVDGPIHKVKFEYDRAREIELESQSYMILRILNEEIDSDINTVLTKITKLL